MQLITEAFNFECQLLDELISLLKIERTVLGTSKLDELEAILERKEVLSQQLEESAAKRDAWIRETESLDKDVLRVLNESMAQKLTECNELNLINGQVINTSMRYQQELIDILTGNNMDGLQDTYAKNGELSSSSKVTHHEEA